MLIQYPAYVYCLFLCFAACGGSVKEAVHQDVGLDIPVQDLSSSQDPLDIAPVDLDVGTDQAEEIAATDVGTQELPLVEEPCSGSLEGIVPGLEPMTILRHPGTPGNAPHLSEVQVWGQHAYIANSFDGLAVVRLEADLMVLTMAKPAGAIVPRCTTLALHEPTASLYCTAPDRLWPKDTPKKTRVASFDLTDPAQPTIRDLAANMNDSFYFRDLHVQGDFLYAAAFDDGLVRMEVSSEGALGQAVNAGYSGHVVQVVGSANKLALLDSDRGLVLLDTQDLAPSELSFVELNGPLLDLAMNESLVAVALGSMGVELMNHQAGTLKHMLSLQPQCVSTGVALQGDSLAITCTSGVHLYRIEEGGAEKVGFVPARYNMLDLAYWEGHLLVLDWEELALFSFDVNGRVLLADVPRGRYIGPGEGARFPVYNPGDHTMQIEVYMDKPMHRDARDLMRTLELLPASTEWIEFSSDEVQAYLDPLWRETLVRVRSNLSACHMGTFNVSDENRLGLVKLVERWESEPAEEGHPAIGEAFPALSVQGMLLSEQILPTQNEASYFVFFGWDCAAMWPELLDLSWLMSSGLIPEGLIPKALSRGSIAQSTDLGERWRVTNILAGIYNENFGSIVNDESPTFHGSDLYTQAFFIGDIPGGAEHPTDYLVDAEGSVFAVDKVYRGLWPLRTVYTTD